MSESQERMMAVVEPQHLDAFMAICDKWDVEAVVVGEVTDGDRLTVDWHGERIVDVPPRTVAHDGPVYRRPLQRPADLDALQADAPPTASTDLRLCSIEPSRSPTSACSRSVRELRLRSWIRVICSWSSLTRAFARPWRSASCCCSRIRCRT